MAKLEEVPGLLEALKERAKSSEGYNFKDIVKIDLPAVLEALTKAHAALELINVAAWSRAGEDNPTGVLRAVARTSDATLKQVAEALEATTVNPK